MNETDATLEFDCRLDLGFPGLVNRSKVVRLRGKGTPNA